METFRGRTFKMLLKNEATTEERVQMLQGWEHSGFNVNSQRRVAKGERAELEKLLQYIERPPVYLERLSYGADLMVSEPGSARRALTRFSSRTS